MSDLSLIYPIIEMRAIDGDTLIARIDVSQRPEIELYLRLAGLSAPELGKRSAINWDGYVALSRVRQWLHDTTLEGSTVKIVGRDKYGRSLAEIFDANGDSLNEFLLGFPEYKVYKK